MVPRPQLGRAVIHEMPSATGTRPHQGPQPAGPPALAAQVAPVCASCRGLPSQAFEYIRYNQGIMGEDTYPYEGKVSEATGSEHHLVLVPKGSSASTRSPDSGPPLPPLWLPVRPPFPSQPRAGSQTPGPARLSQKGPLCLGRLARPPRPCRLLLGSVSPVSLSGVPQGPPAPRAPTERLACPLAMASAGPAPATGLCREDGASRALCRDLVARRRHMQLPSCDRTAWGPRSRPAASALTCAPCPLPPQTGWHLQVPAQEGHRFCQGRGQHHPCEYCPFPAFA